MNNITYHKTIDLLFFKLKIKRLKKYKKIAIQLKPVDGIGNRINDLMFSLCFDKPSDIVVYWDTTSWVTKKFSELFIFKPKNTNIIEVNNTDALNNFKDYNLLQEHQYILKDKYKDIYIPYFRILKPSKPVEKRIEDFNKINNVDYISIQVRNNSDWENCGRNEDLELFYNEIDKYPEPVKFYLSAMNEEVLNKFKTKYGDKILSLPNKDYASMVDAVADLYLLSKAKTAIYSYGSTFGQLAYNLSGCEQNTKYIGNDSKWNDLN